MAREILLVRHGDYDDYTKELNDVGKEQASQARDVLMARGLGIGTLLLSSDAPRALGTAEIIGEGLNAKPIASKRVNIGGNRPSVVESLDDFLATSLKEAHASTFNEDSNVVVVTHAPLIVAVMGLERVSQVRYGGIYEAPGSWVNPRYSDYDHRMAFSASR